MIALKVIATSILQVLCAVHVAVDVAVYQAFVAVNEAVVVVEPLVAVYFNFLASCPNSFCFYF